MLKRTIFLIGALVFALRAEAAPRADYVSGCVSTVAAPTYAEGTAQPCSMDLTGNMRMSGSLSISGTVDQNLKQVNGATVNVGTGAAGTGTQRVTTSTDSTIATVTAITGGGVASGATDSGNPLKTGGVYNTSIPTFTAGQRGDTQMDTHGGTKVCVVDTAGACVDPTTAVATNNTPTALAAQAATSGASSVLESSHILKASSGNLYWLTTTTDANAGFLMIFNATSAPVDGAVTPAYCIPIAASSGTPLSWTAVPFAFTTGITVVYSSTGCLTKTASVHATFYWGAL